jgi:excisionase family DNA binding protein
MLSAPYVVVATFIAFVASVYNESKEGKTMKTMKESRPVPLAITESDQTDIQALYQKIARSQAKLVGPDGRSQRLPFSLYDFLVQLIADLQEGKSVSIIQSEATLTTVEAANMLGVSRQFLVKTLDSDQIPHHKVGTHRRIYVRDLLKYKAERDGRRRKLLDDLVEAEIQEGLYDAQPPSDDQSR